MPNIPDPGRLFYGQTNFVKLAFVRLLQAAFSHESTPEEYRWAPTNPEPGVKSEQGQRQLWIYRASPKRTTGLPAIFVEAEPSDSSIKMLGQEIMRQDFEFDPVLKKDVLVADIYAGVIWIPVKLTIVAKTTTDREILTDMVTSQIRYLFRDKFLKEKIEYLDIQAGDQSEDGDNPENRRFYGSVTVRCQTQFSQYVDRRLYDKIMSINLDDIRYGTNKDDLTKMPG
jgi:hypothetical protein